ncbi:MAG: hypothetical protein EB059_03955 [Alphaproteobacteria bacterium]|nr:hypothetical protein [Alphaproteobacteria bacterium]
MVEAITTKTIANAKATPVADSSVQKSASTVGEKAAEVASASQPLNPRLRYDRLAGVVVTEFMNHAGTVQLQTPSTAVLAYLRAGLGADGHSKNPSIDEQQAKKSDTSFDS